MLNSRVKLEDKDGNIIFAIPENFSMHFYSTDFLIHDAIRKSMFELKKDGYKFINDEKTCLNLKDNLEK